jgi:hypothetical protein
MTTPILTTLEYYWKNTKVFLWGFLAVVAAILGIVAKSLFDNKVRGLDFTPPAPNPNLIKKVEEAKESANSAKIKAKVTEEAEHAKLEEIHTITDDVERRKRLAEMANSL